MTEGAEDALKALPNAFYRGVSGIPRDCHTAPVYQRARSLKLFGILLLASDFSIWLTSITLASLGPAKPRCEPADPDA